MVLKINNQLMPFSTYGGSQYKKKSKKKSKKSKKRRSYKNKRSYKKKKRTNKKKRRKTCNADKCKCKNCKCNNSIVCDYCMKGGFIRARSPVFNWGDTCPNTGKAFAVN